MMAPTMDAPAMSADPNIDASIRWRPGQSVWLESQNYFMRTLKPEDVSDRLLGWCADPEVMVPLGAEPRAYSRAEVIDYIGGFDSIGGFLLGIFVKDTGLHIGWRSIEYDGEKGWARTNPAIGDKSYRGRGVNFELRNVVYDFSFYSVGIKWMMATVYSDDMLMRRRAERAGYRAFHNVVRPHKGTDGKKREVIVLSLGERDWRAKRRWLCAPIWRAGCGIGSPAA